MNATSHDRRSERKRLLKGDAFWIAVILLWLLAFAPLFQADEQRPEEQKNQTEE